ncbi:MAG: ATP-binding protein, partial [Bacillota bacterium]|nr:ATP-binding protein [Bacillota bacterium]
PDLLLNDKEIRQLLLNLIQNGLESMDTGGCLDIKTFVEGGEVVLKVRDQGNGISHEQLEKIGTPFFTTKANGTGLGLATCYSIANRHNATIKIDTGPEGSTFYVRFKVSA